MNKKILVIDNDIDFLETRVEILEDEGYEVYQAVSLEEAEALLESSWVHLAIIDVRLREDTDDKDTSGIALAKEEAYRPIAKIILTRYPTYQYVREALGPALDGLPPAVAFIAKQEGIEVMFDAVEKAFEKHVRINWQLTICWDTLYSFEKLVRWLTPQTTYILLADRVGELEDLFRKLFTDYSQITINRCFSAGEGQVILELFAYGEAGEEQFVLSCGERDFITKELKQYEQFVPQGAGVGSTIKEKMAETTHFAAIAYRLVGGDLEEMLPFKDFYATQPAETVGTALDHLFAVSLAPWHKKRRSYEAERTPSELYRACLGLSDELLEQAAFEQRVAAICRETLKAGLTPLDYAPDNLTFHLPDSSTVSYPNPVLTLFGEPFPRQPITCALTHGQVGANTILVNQKGETWLRAFSHAGIGPLLRDWVSLELDIRLDLLKTTDLSTRHKLEQRLLSVSELAAPIPRQAFAPDEEKALNAIERLRHAAAPLPGSNHSSYLTALFFCCLKRLLSYNPERRYSRRRLLPYAHALLLAAMLTEKLISPKQSAELTPQARTSLWIDEANKQVWLKGQQVNLTPQEYQILAYLYQNAGQLASRKQIVEEALSQAYDKSIGASQLNSAISRLRQKIELDPSHPQYLMTVRGYGYKLGA